MVPYTINEDNIIKKFIGKLGNASFISTVMNSFINNAQKPTIRTKAIRYIIIRRQKSNVRLLLSEYN